MLALSAHGPKLSGTLEESDNYKDEIPFMTVFLCRGDEKVGRLKMRLRSFKYRHRKEILTKTPRPDLEVSCSHAHMSAWMSTNMAYHMSITMSISMSISMSVLCLPTYAHRISSANLISRSACTCSARTSSCQRTMRTATRSWYDVHYALHRCGASVAWMLQGCCNDVARMLHVYSTHNTCCMHVPHIHASTLRS